MDIFKARKLQQKLLRDTNCEFKFGKCALIKGRLKYINVYLLIPLTKHNSVYLNSQFLNLLAERNQIVSKMLLVAGELRSIKGVFIIEEIDID